MVDEEAEDRVFIGEAMSSCLGENYSGWWQNILPEQFRPIPLHGQ